MDPACYTSPPSTRLAGCDSRGDVAQLGERRVRIAEARGSSPLISTIRGSVGQVVSPRVCKTLAFGCGSSILPRPTSIPELKRPPRSRRASSCRDGVEPVSPSPQGNASVSDQGPSTNGSPGQPAVPPGHERGAWACGSIEPDRETPVALLGEQEPRRVDAHRQRPVAAAGGARPVEVAGQVHHVDDLALLDLGGRDQRHRRRPPRRRSPGGRRRASPVPATTRRQAFASGILERDARRCPRHGNSTVSSGPPPRRPRRRHWVTAWLPGRRRGVGTGVGWDGRRVGACDTGVAATPGDGRGRRCRRRRRRAAGRARRRGRVRTAGTWISRQRVR